MKTRYKVLILILVAAGSFLAGSWVNSQGGRSKAVAERKILHYVDPMNPAFKSEKPGIAPCGMPLEPVYADQGDAEGSDLRASLPPGTVRISPGKQQLIGVKTAMVEKAPWSHTRRVLGRVTPDETLVYRVNAAVNCTIETVLPVTTGSLVKKDELLATYYAPDYRTTLLVYYNLIRSGAAAAGAGSASGATQTAIGSAASREIRSRGFENYGLSGRSDTGLQREYYRQILINYGFGEKQLAEMERTLTIPAVIEVRAPVGGFILYRNISEGLRVDRGVELFRVADLSRVWILADIFENEASYFKPGMRVPMELPYQKQTLYAQVSPVLPQFDPATRTLKVRLVADNPGFALRPEMFVNVEFPLSGPPAILVPIDAVIDSGLKRTVFVDKGNGYFEPRQVETGRSLGERVEISRGLIPGEKIVVSGNFLIDSEARMQQAASGIFGKIGRDPVCGMNIDEDRARAEGNYLEYRGQTYFFCDRTDREEFRKDPERYLKLAQMQGSAPTTGSQDNSEKHPSHIPAAVSKPPGAKTAPEGHDAKAMPKTSAAPAKAESRAEEMAMPPAAPAEMGHPQPPYPTGMTPPGVSAAAPAPAEMGHPQPPYPTGMTPPGVSAAAPAPAEMGHPQPPYPTGMTPPGEPAAAPAPAEMGHPQPSYPTGMTPPGEPAVAPAPAGKSGQIPPPAAARPGVNQHPAGPLPGEPAVAPAPAGESGQIPPPAAARPGAHPRMFPRYPPRTRVRPMPESTGAVPSLPPKQGDLPGLPQGGGPGLPQGGGPGLPQGGGPGLPQGGAPGLPQGLAPMPGPPVSGGKTLPGAVSPPMPGGPGINQGPPAVPGQGRMPMPEEAAPPPGGEAGKALPPATGASDVKPR